MQVLGYVCAKMSVKKVKVCCRAWFTCYRIVKVCGMLSLVEKIGIRFFSLVKFLFTIFEFVGDHIGNQCVVLDVWKQHTLFHINFIHAE